MREVLNHKFIETNQEYTTGRKLLSGAIGVYDKLAYKAYETLLAIRLRRKKDGQ